ncbi:Serine protease gd N-terminus [Popillia japonica]|uniref:Serine protease gd N-terminus n=1 Tax=Popillia japonica TaxID=7064 RepID=A0AAW1MPB8_POPJA
MKRLLTFKFVLLPILYFTIILSGKISAQQLESPCPNVFVYEKRVEVWLLLVFDRAPLEIGNWFGEVRVQESRTFLIKNRKHKLIANIPLHVRFYAKYDPSKPVPRIVRINLNARTICPENQPTPPTDNGLNTTSSTPVRQSIGAPLAVNNPPGSVVDDDYFPGDFAGFKVQPIRIEYSTTCGTLAIRPNPATISGAKTKPGEFPWHAALYHTRGNSLNYTCGGSLISRYHVLTAAHCVSKPISQASVDVGNLLVYLGKYYLKGWSNPGLQGHRVSKIIRHPQYNFHQYTHDIAVIKLSRRVEYTDFVRPICLWEGAKDVDHLTRRLGTVVGWGYDKEGNLTEELTMLNMPIVSKEVCVRSLPEFYPTFATNDTYCAGFLNGTTTCNGDSGAGMIFEKETGISDWKAYHLRGLVSVSAALQNEAKCDQKNYVVFTDVAKYLEFIEEAMAQ